jgi:imidazolonepropionase-like amidohydrolase
VKTPLLDQIEVKLKAHVKQYKELRPMWLISLIKALKGLHITHHDVKHLSQSEIAFRRRPLIQTEIRGTMDDWLDRMPPENFEDRDQEVDNFIELFENELLKDYTPNIGNSTDIDDNLSKNS